MIDFSLAIDHFQNNYQYRRDIWDFKFGTGVIANPTLPDEMEEGGCVSVFTESNADFKPTFLMEDSAFDNDLRTDFTDKTTLLEERPYSEKLPNEILMLLPPRVYGFSLLDRKWYAFDITKVDDIKDSGHGFEHLVLSKGHKKIVQALVQHHTQGPALARAQARTIEQDFSMDVVRGKDQGLIILLHGVPGVGKTSTAECVAAQTKRPLFPITCGDIGTTPEDVERRLNEYFDMAHKWGCVLLLDEAVFLGKREKGGDLLRNGVVSGTDVAQSILVKLIEFSSVSKGLRILLRHSDPHYKSYRRVR